MKRILHIPVKGKYFHEIKDGTKYFEYRLITEYWRKRLEGRTYDEVHIKLGYPKSNDTSRILVRPWRGYEYQTITHAEFGGNSVDVFAIGVN